MHVLKLPRVVRWAVAWADGTRDSHAAGLGPRGLEQVRVGTASWTDRTLIEAGGSRRKPRGKQRHPQPRRPAGATPHPPPRRSLPAALTHAHPERTRSDHVRTAP